MEKILQLIKEGDDEVHFSFAADIHTLIMEKFFSTYWKPGVFVNSSGLNLIDMVNQHNPKSVLDIGCGYNQYKGHIHNLIGIDPYIKQGPDIITTLYEYHRDNPSVQHDAILALASINYGPYPKIIQEIEMINNLLADGGRLYMRINPGEQFDHPQFALAQLIEVFPWTEEFTKRISTTYGWNIEIDVEDTASSGHIRRFIVFHKE